MDNKSAFITLVTPYGKYLGQARMDVPQLGAIILSGGEVSRVTRIAYAHSEIYATVVRC